MHRRTLLRRAAAVGTLGVVGSQSANAALDHESVPNHVTIDYDDAWLKTYRPAFSAAYETMQRSDAVYAYRARSDEYEYDAAVFWHRLTHQDGLPLVKSDGHDNDHEPVVVFVDSDGVVQEIAYSYYHHFRDLVDRPAVGDLLIASETSDPTHPALEIVNPHHHYQAAPDLASEDAITSYDFADWTTVIDTWESRDVYAATADEAVFDPGMMRSRDSWWDRDSRDYQVARMWHRLGDVLDVAGSGQAGRYEG